MNPFQPRAKPLHVVVLKDVNLQLYSEVLCTKLILQNLEIPPVKVSISNTGQRYIWMAFDDPQGESNALNAPWEEVFESVPHAELTARPGVPNSSSRESRSKNSPRNSGVCSCSHHIAELSNQVKTLSETVASLVACEKQQPPPVIYNYGPQYYNCSPPSSWPCSGATMDQGACETVVPSLARNPEALSPEKPAKCPPPPGLVKRSSALEPPPGLVKLQT